MAVKTLPKYIKEANYILEILETLPEQTWRKTQRELADELEIAPPVLSARVKLLIDEGKVKKGDPLPMRGRNHELILVDPTPFDGPVAHHNRDTRDRALNEDDTPIALELGEFSPEKIGHAIISTLRDYWENEDQLRRSQKQHEIAVKALRERLEEEHWRAEKLDEEKEELEEQLREVRNQMARLNQRIVDIMSAEHNGGNNRRILSGLDDESQDVLRALVDIHQ